MNELSGAQKMMIAVGLVFAIGFFMVGDNKEQTDEERKVASMIRDRANMNRILTQKCPKYIRQYTGTTIMSLVANTKTDNSSYLTYEYKGDKGDNFKDASCTLSVSDTGFHITNVTIDGDNKPTQ